MPKLPPLPPLSRRERQIMDVLYARQTTGADRGAGGGRERGASIADVLAGLPDPPSYSAVRALVNILENKGHVRHRRQSNRYYYEPTTPQKLAAKSALHLLLDTFFAGSIENVLATHLADPKTHLSPEEFQRLNALIQEAQQRDKS